MEEISTYLKERNVDGGPSVLRHRITTSMNQQYVAALQYHTTRRLPVLLGQLSLASLQGRLIEYQLRLGEGRECHLCRVAGNTV